MNKETFFGENFKKYRKRKGISQKEFACLLYEATGKQLTLTSISNYETGLHLPPPQILPVVADILGVSIDALFGAEEALSFEEQAPLSYVDGYRQELENLKKEFAALLLLQKDTHDKQQEPVRIYCQRLLEIVGKQQDELQTGHAQLAAVRKMISLFRDKL